MPERHTPVYLIIFFISVYLLQVLINYTNSLLQLFSISIYLHAWIWVGCYFLFGIILSYPYLSNERQLEARWQFDITRFLIAFIPITMLIIFNIGYSYNFYKPLSNIHLSILTYLAINPFFIQGVSVLAGFALMSCIYKKERDHSKFRFIYYVFLVFMFLLLFQLLQDKIYTKAAANFMQLRLLDVILFIGFILYGGIIGLELLARNTVIKVFNNRTLIKTCFPLLVIGIIGWNNYFTLLPLEELFVPTFSLRSTFFSQASLTALGYFCSFCFGSDRETVLPS